MRRLSLGTGWTFVLCTYAFVLAASWDAPPFSFHQWREADSADFVLNYKQDNEGFFLPKVHQRGLGPGYAAAEFPGIYYLSSFLIDPNDTFYWRLRLVSFAHLLLAVASFGLLVRLISKDNCLAHVASILFATNPLLLYYGIKIMPEVYYLAWGLLGCYLVCRWLSGIGSSVAGLLGITALCLSCMLKPFGIFFLCPPLYLAARPPWRTSWPKVVCLTPPLLCLFVWNGYARNLSQRYSPGVFDLSFDHEKWWHAVSSFKFYQRAVGSYLVELYLGFVGTTTLVATLLMRRVPKHIPLMAWITCGVALVFIFGAHHLLTLHDYYGLILVPPLTWYVAMALLSWSEHPSHKHQYIANLLFLLSIAVNVTRIAPRLLRPHADYRSYINETSSLVPLSQRVLVLDDTPVVKLNLINRYGSTLPKRSPPALLWQKLEKSSYWFVCFKEESDCSAFARQPWLSVAESQHLMIIKPSRL